MSIASTQRTKKKKIQYLRKLIWIPIILIVGAMMYTINQNNIYNAAEYQSESALSDYIENENNISYLENDPVLLDKSLVRIEADLIRQANFNATSAVELTYIFEHENKKYKVVSIVENIEDGDNVADWEFWKVESIEELE